MGQGPERIGLIFSEVASGSKKQAGEGGGGQGPEEAPDLLEEVMKPEEDDVGMASPLSETGAVDPWAHNLLNLDDITKETESQGGVHRPSLNEIKGETIEVAGQRRQPPAPLRRMSSGNDVFFKKTQDPFTYSASSSQGGRQLSMVPPQQQQGYYPPQQGGYPPQQFQQFQQRQQQMRYAQGNAAAAAAAFPPNRQQQQQQQQPSAVHQAAPYQQNGASQNPFF